MNPGKKLIRNTVFGVWTVAVLFVGLNRLQATPGAGSGGSSFTLGLRQDRQPEPRPEADLATARDFNRLSVRGPLEVEVVGSTDFKVTLVPGAGGAPEIHTYLGEGTLRVDAGDPAGEPRAVLRVEVPTLQRIDAGTSRVTIRGLAAPVLTVEMYRGGQARLEQNQVRDWVLSSAHPLDVQVDDATFATGSLRTDGNVVIRRAP
jgi:hypothetical protein